MWLIAASVVGRTTAADFPLVEKMDLKIQYAGFERTATWRADLEGCTVAIDYGPTNTIPTLPAAPPTQVWVLTKNGGMIHPTSGPMFIQFRGLGSRYQHSFYFKTAEVTNATAVVVKMSTNFVAHSVRK